MKTENTAVQVEATKSAEKTTERKIQLSISALTELANDEKLLQAFKKAMDENPEMKAPVGLQFAKAMVKQTSPTV